jgi:hypothetical protein
MSDDRPTVTGAVSKLGQSLITALPPGFLLLCIINILFLGIVMWFLDDQVAQRTSMVGKLLDQCMQIALEHEPKK